MPEHSKCDACGAMVEETNGLLLGQPCPQCGSYDLRMIIKSGSPNAQARAWFAAAAPDGRVIVEDPPVLPDLLVQAVVERIGRTNDGELIVAIRPAFDAYVQLLQRDPDALFRIDPRKWEEIIAASYERAGCQDVILTPRSGDLGRDVIATWKGLYTIRIVDQVKALGPGQRVTADDVRALLGVLTADANANKGYVTTTADFAPMIEKDRLLAPFMPTRLELINGDALRKRLARIANGDGANEPQGA